MTFRRKIIKKYEINEKAKVITCILTTENDIAVKLEKYGLPVGDYKYKLAEVRKYVGIARCAPGDEWNELYGKKLAEYRADKARQQDVNKVLKNYISNFLDKIDNLYDYGLLKDPHKPEEGNKYDESFNTENLK